MDQPYFIIVAIVRLLRFAAHIILVFAETLSRITPATHRSLGHRSPMTYRHELNAVKLQEVPLFVSLLEDIRHHFLISETTRRTYASIADQFFIALDPAVRSTFKQPTEQDFYDYVFYNWPTFSSFQPPFTGGVVWGWVAKGDLEPNEVNIASDMVVSAATWTSHRRLSLDLYRLMITVTILHEISHSFTKHYFNQLFTPLGVGEGRLPSRYGESGFLVEERLFRGRITACWNNEEEGSEGNLANLSHVVLNKDSNDWIIDADVAERLLSSLRRPILDWPERSTLSPHVPSGTEVRARLTEANKPVLTTAASTSQIGLGIKKGAVSFIGGDRAWMEEHNLL